jgi:hypothetical protein
MTFDEILAQTLDHQPMVDVRHDPRHQLYDACPPRSCVRRRSRPGDTRTPCDEEILQAMRRHTDQETASTLAHDRRHQGLG